MLVIISDLHFTDESSGKHNVPSRAFEGAFKDIRRYRDTSASEIKLVFLGDTFDLVRTTYWAGVPECGRPWGDDAGILERNANDLLDAIIEKNAEPLRFFREELVALFDREVEKIYVPGNHDRLCHVYGTLRGKVRAALGIKGGDGPFMKFYDDRLYGNRYGVFARHGHEFDKWNHEGVGDSVDDSLAPIGDLIAAEIVARIPLTVMKNAGDSIPEQERDEFERNLKEVDNVRPFSAILDWIFYQVSDNRELRDAVERSMAEIAVNFQGLQYLKKWYARHDRFLIVDETEEVQALLEIFKRFSVDAAENLIRIFSAIFGSKGLSAPDDSDKELNKKAVDFLQQTTDYRTLVMGHTHNPLQLPVRVVGDLEQVYINTGTWRKKYVRGAGSGFIGVKNLSYAIIYSRDENPNQFFETWTGTLKEL